MKYNHLLKINNAFPNGYIQGDKIKFTIKGVTNPPSTKPTQPIHIGIYYEFTDDKGVTQNEFIDKYSGNELIFNATSSPLISITVKLSSKGTGQSNE